MPQKLNFACSALYSAGWILIGVLFLHSNNANAEIVWRSKIYLATLENGSYQSSKSSEFGCDDTIYLFYESADQSLATEMLEVVWQNRETKVIHKTRMPFQPKSKGGRLWSWSGIEFTGGGNALDKLTAFLDPAAGREQFIGGWDVQATVRGKSLKTLRMKVLC